MERPANTRIYETPITDCWVMDDGIVYMVSKPGDRSIENYSALFKVFAELSQQGTKKFAILCNISKIEPHTKEVREFVAAETGRYVCAMALISATPRGAAVGSIYELLSTTPYPLASFSIQQEAIQWLKQQVEQGPQQHSASAKE